MRIQIRRNPNLYRKYPFYSNLRESPVIYADDSPDVVKKKRELAINNAKALREVKNGKFDDIVATLELFNGQLSLNDVLNQDIPILNELKEAKMRLNNNLAKEREKEAERRQRRK